MKLSIPSVAIAACLIAPLSSQSLEEGYQSAMRALPSTASAVTYLDNGWLVYFDTLSGTDLVLDTGGSTSVLLQVGSPVFASFAVQVTHNSILFGESSNNEIWLVPFDGSGAPTLLGTIDFNFAAARYDDTTALVSAKTGGFIAADNDVLALNLKSGAVDPIALIPGASGPLVVDENGDLFYATASNTFPQPAGFAEVLRFDSSVVQAAFGPTVLTDAAATVVYSGLDAAGSLAFDKDRDLFVVDWANNQVLEISDVDGPWTRLTVLYDYSSTPVFASSVQFLSSPIGTSEVRFEPFQPLLAGALAVVETDFFSETNVRFATPARPITVATPKVVPAGPFAIHTFGGPANGLGVMRWGAPSNLIPEFGVALGVYEQLIPWGLGAPTTAVPIFFDATGTSTLSLVNPGFGTQVDLAVQVIFVNPATTVIGSAKPTTFSVL